MMRRGGLAVSACVAVVSWLSGSASADPAMDAAIADSWSFGNSRLYSTIGYLKTTYGEANYRKWFPRETNISGANYGKWIVTEPNRYYGWESGHWTGSLWQNWRRTGDGNMLQWAKDWTAGIEIVKNNPLDHDLGFRFMNSFYLGYTLLDDATDPGGTYRSHAKDVLLTAAAGLNTRFNNGGFPVGEIEAVGRNGWLAPYGVVVDSMMNIQLLFAGWDLSGRPTSGAARTWYDHAVTHARTILEQNVRSFAPGDPRAADDGSTYHGSTHYDNSTYTPANRRGDPNFYGKLYYKMTAQGYGDETTWSRGQAWTLYGYTQTYSYTRDDPNVASLFLDAASRTANYFISHLPNNYTADPYNHVDGDFVPPTDFDAALGEPNGPWNDYNNDRVYGDRRAATHAYVQRDSSAAAIAASGLLELSTLVTDPNLREKYFTTAEDILWSLMTFTGGDGQLDYLAKDSNHMGILTNARGAYGGAEYSMAVADYYFLEALQRYQAIPEPATCTALLTGVLAGAFLRRRRRSGRGRS